MRKLFLFISFSVLSFSVFSQEEDDITLTYKESRVAATKPGSWFADKGKIYQIDKSGNTVEYKVGGTRFELNSIQFVTKERGFAVGDSGTIVKTTDGGMSWEPVMCPLADANLNHVYFVNINVGYIVGTYGAILKTIDKGESWTVQNSSTTKDLFMTHFVNTDIGFVVGENGRILKTVNGGGKWKRISAIGFDDITDMSFIDEKNGYVVSTKGVMYHTVNGGRNWYKVERELY